MTTPNCTGAPLSWLAMEQYHLGELPQAERIRVRRHLEICPGCVKCMDTITNSDIRLKPLPPLPTSSWTLSAFQWKWLAGLSAAAAGIAILLLVIPRDQAVSSIPPVSMGYKGGDLAIGLTRYRDSSVSDSPGQFEDGDTFSVRVTCPPIGEVSWDVAVFQGNEVFFPYENRAPLTCGNGVYVNGGFSLSGRTTTVVCVSIEGQVNRRAVKTKGIQALPDTTVCTTLFPVAEQP